MRLSLASTVHLFLVTTAFVAHADVLYRNTTIATWNDTTKAVEVLRGASLLIQGNTVAKISSSVDEIAMRGAEVIDASDKIIVPGFISTHHHVWQALYKTLLPNTPFTEYFPMLGHSAPISQTLTADDVYSSELMGALDLMNEGTTSWVDITSVLSPDCVNASMKASLTSGGRSFFGAMLQPKPSFPEENQIAQIRDLASRPELRNQSLVSLGFSYDIFDGSSPQSRERILNLLHTTNLSFITTHYIGGPFGGYNSPTLLNSSDWSLLNGTLPILFSHSSFVTALDAKLLRENNQYISTAPESESHFGHGNPHAHRIQDQTAIGADTSLTYSSSIVSQARMWLQQLRSRLQQQQVDNWIINSNTPMTVNQAFYLATRAGALALRRPDLGIIAQGSKADLVVFDTSDQNLIGWRDPVAAVILHSNPGNIRDVLVDGKFVKRDFKLTFSGLKKLRADFEQRAQVFEQRFRTWNFSTQAPDYYGLGVSGKALEVDVVRGNATGY